VEAFGSFVALAMEDEEPGSRPGPEGGMRQDRVQRAVPRRSFSRGAESVGGGGHLKDLAVH